MLIKTQYPVTILLCIANCSLLIKLLCYKQVTNDITYNHDFVTGPYKNNELLKQQKQLLPLGQVIKYVLITTVWPRPLHGWFRRVILHDSKYTCKHWCCWQKIKSGVLAINETLPFWLFHSDCSWMLIVFVLIFFCTAKQTQLQSLLPPELLTAQYITLHICHDHLKEC